MAAKPEDEAANAGDDNAEEEDAQPEDAEDGAEEFPEEQEGSQGEEEINDDNEDKYEDSAPLDIATRLDPSRTFFQVAPPSRLR